MAIKKTNLQSFVAQFVAVVKGDDAAVLAEKVYRQRQAALISHLASYKGDLVDLEVAVEDAQEKFNKFRLNNGTMIENRRSYITSLIAAKEAITDAEEALVSQKETIKFIEEEIALM